MDSQRVDAVNNVLASKKTTDSVLPRAAVEPLTATHPRRFRAARCKPARRCATPGAAVVNGKRVAGKNKVFSAASLQNKRQELPLPFNAKIKQQLTGTMSRFDCNVKKAITGAAQVSDLAVLTPPPLDPSSPDFHDELERLRLLYSPLVVQKKQKIAVPWEQNPPGGLSVTLTVLPTDPDFPVQTLRLNGLQLVLVYGYTTSATEDAEPWFCRCSLLDGSYRLCCKVSCTDATVPPLIQTAITSAFQFGLARPCDPATAVYDALNAVNHCLEPAFRYSSENEPTAYAAYTAQFSPSAWSQDEQQRLEEALIWYNRVADPKIKWKRISDFVSARAPCRRSPKECASRFLECRRAVLSEKQATSEASFPTHDDDVSAGVKSPGDHPACFSTCATPNDKANFRLEEKKETHRDAQLKWIIELENLMLQRVQLFFLATLRIQLACTRCRSLATTTLKFPHLFSSSNADDAGSQLTTGDHKTRSVDPVTVITSKTQCVKCLSPLCVTAAAVLASEQQNAVARYACMGGSITNILPSDFYVECGQCSTSLLVQHVLTGVRRTATCPSCYTALEFVFNSIKVNGASLASTAPMIKTETKKRRQGALSAEQGALIKLGFPLPLNGACKHYKKSLRWFRFPCCGQAFPCDICHDTQTDHEHERALRMICGHCSKEQACSDKPCACGNVVRADKTSHWEGGKGCRNPIAMSQKDNKKYKLLHKMKRKAVEQRQLQQKKTNAPE